MSKKRKATSPPAATVTVRGDAVVRTGPDEALLWLTLTALDQDPGAALADVATRSRALTVVLDEFGISDADRATMGIGVHEEFTHENGAPRSAGHRATARLSVRLSDAELISRLISRCTSQMDARVDGPQWLIAADNPARLAAARRAAQDAQRRAEAYAAGVGARLGRLLEISEADHAGPRPMFARSAARMAALEPIAVEAGEHEVGASVLVTYMLELGETTHAAPGA